MTFSLIDGFVMPTFGVFVAHIIASLIQWSKDPAFYEAEAYKYVYLCLGLTIYETCNNTLALWAGTIVGQNITKNIRLAVFDKLLRLPMTWFEKEANQQEKIVSNLTASCRVLHSFMSLELPFTVIVFANIFYSIIAALVFDWRTALSTLGLIPLILLSQTIQTGFTQGFSQSKSKFYDQSSQIVNESVLNIRTVFSLGSPEETSARYERRVDNIFWIVFKKSMVTAFMLGVSNLLTFGTFGLTLFISVIFVSKYDISIESSLSANFLILFACISAGNKANNVQNLFNVSEAVEWLFSKLDLETEQ
jgi:ABC-type multidrug transport system fused ATPase/permease subunit